MHLTEDEEIRIRILAGDNEALYNDEMHRILKDKMSQHDEPRDRIDVTSTVDTYKQYI
ncbi:hypothetical protein [Leminorella grimontii]|uniref:hypothetical protein n=1 Tax=Leminorella grimontii TaxID=82981 RepID=UPI00208889E6|nr:hypothetical protein [Leminorella grimontii]GKX60655.1 hypothetical protein SOASR031_29700 [Leminorella grimontii]